MIFRPAILYVDDEQNNLNAFERSFQSEYLVKTCLSGQIALQLLEKEKFPLVIADQKMPGLTGIELCEKLMALYPQTVRMILTAYTETDLLLNAINRGHVHDYIVKPWRKAELKPIIERAFEAYKERVTKLRELEARAAKSDQLNEQIQEIYDFEGIIGASSGLKSVVEKIKKVAPTDSTCLITGETGTGKEVIARAIHENSNRRNGPFVPVHCGALAKTVLESELFGHEKGAFTGANQIRQGRFEVAQNGTLFLDELAEIQEDVQIKLLRVLQEKEIQRVGGNQTIPVDIRLITATNKNLDEAVRAGEFREDLFYRLNVVPIKVPPLRDRTEDIPILTEYFLKKYCSQLGRNLTLADAALEHLLRYDWPGNVRELQNILERAVILSVGPEIEVDDLNLNIDEMLRTESVDIEKTPPPSSVRHELQQEEIQRLKDALRKAGGNVSQAARHMGIARSTLFDRLKKYQLI